MDISVNGLRWLTSLTLRATGVMWFTFVHNVMHYSKSDIEPHDVSLRPFSTDSVAVKGAVFGRRENMVVIGINSERMFLQFGWMALKKISLQ